MSQDTTTLTEEEQFLSFENKDPRHYVELDPHSGKPISNKAVCGAIISKVGVAHNGSICQDCVDEVRRRYSG